MASRAASTTIESYEREANEYVRHWRRGRRPPLLQACLALVPKGARMLDLGCGPGQDVHALERRGYAVLGLDLSKVLLRHARGRSRRMPLVQADMGALPIRRHVFDGVWAAASLIHLTNVVPHLILDSF